MKTHNQPLIFVVDSNLLYRKFIIQYLKAADFSDILTFADARECLEFIDLKPDIIISELHYKNEKFNGIDLLMKMKIINPATKFIFISLYNDMEAAVRTIRLGAVDFIVKNKLALDKMVHRINQLVMFRHEIRKANSASIKLAASITVILVIFISLIFLYNH